VVVCYLQVPDSCSVEQRARKEAWILKHRASEPPQPLVPLPHLLDVHDEAFTTLEVELRAALNAASAKGAGASHNGAMQQLRVCAVASAVMLSVSQCHLFDGRLPEGMRRRRFLINFEGVHGGSAFPSLYTLLSLYCLCSHTCLVESSAEACMPLQFWRAGMRC
jgi:hypothetical protein